MSVRFCQRGKDHPDFFSRSPNANPMTSSSRERLRRRYRPVRVEILFVGESPPASGRFFYRADSGLYRAVRDTFFAAFPALRQTEFLDSFRSLGCYLVDLCGEPVDNIPPHERQRACSAGEARLARTIRGLRPKVIITIVRSIRANVRRAEEQAEWSGMHRELPYPGRWYRHRTRFRRQLVPLLRNLGPKGKDPRKDAKQQ